jgi:hypothetical protein
MKLKLYHLAAGWLLPLIAIAAIAQPEEKQAPPAATTPLTQEEKGTSLPLAPKEDYLPPATLAPAPKPASPLLKQTLKELTQPPAKTRPRVKHIRRHTKKHITRKPYNPYEQYYRYYYAPQYFSYQPILQLPLPFHFWPFW